MELLLLLLLTPSVIPAQRYRSSSSTSSLASNPNDEPFLPIYPIYPYSPKLIKRGTERDLVGQLTPELYAPKIDARDTYTSSFGGNYQRDPYYPSYNPYPKTSSSYPASGAVSNPGYTSTGSYPTTASFASPSAYATSNSAYSTQNVAAAAAGGAGGVYTSPNTYSPYGAGYTSPYPYSAAPYGIYNSYTTPYTAGPTPYPTSPYAAGTYPNYNYQAPYYYPNYYNQPYPAHPPPPPPHSDYSGSSSSEDNSEETEPTSKTSSSKKSEGKKNRYKDNDSETSSEAKDGQFVDGANFVSSGAKDLDGQSTTYKAPNPYNQLEQGSDVHLRSVTIPGLPRTTYRVISVGGQPVGPDYPLPQSYAKVQQLEQIMSQTLAKLLAQQNTANQAAQTQYQYQNNEQTDNSGNFGFTGLINKSPQPVIAKTGLAYRVGPSNLPKTVNSPGGQFVSNYGTGQNPLIIKVQDPGQSLQQSSTILSKAAGKYAEEHYSQKPVTTVSLQQSPGVYIPPEAKNLKDENSSDPSEQYNDYDTNAGQNYENSNASYKKNEQNYGIDQSQGVPYHSSNLVTVQTPQAQSYQYSSYLPTQSTQQQQQQQLRDYKTSLDDVNFGTKRNSKV